MQAAVATRIEDHVTRAAAAVFALACGFAAYAWFSASLIQPALGAFTGGAGALAYLCCLRALAAVDPAEQVTVPSFSVAQFDGGAAEELMLTEVYEPQAEADTLILDDILAELGPDSRVVRLFDRNAMPTPGQLKSRIDTHLQRGGAAEGGSSDATQALHDALAELRRSIR